MTSIPDTASMKSTPTKVPMMSSGKQSNHLDASPLGKLLKETGELFDSGEDKKWVKKMNEDQDLTMAKECQATGLELEEWLERRQEETSLPECYVAVSSTAAGPSKSLFGGKKKKQEFAIEALFSENGAMVRTHARRSLKDFDLLHAGLVERFPGMCVPPVPSQKHELFGEALLTEFLSCVMANEFLSCETLVVDFLSKEKFERSKKGQKRSSLFHSHELSPSAMRWSQAMASAETVPNLAKTSSLASEKLVLIHSDLTAFRLALEVERKQTSVLASSSAQVASKLTNWSESEAKAWEELSQGATAHLAALRAMDQAQMGRTERLAQLGKEMHQGLIIPLSYELLYIESFLARLRPTQSAIKALHKATAALQAAKDKVDSGRTKSKKTLFQAATAAIKVQIKARPEVSGLLGLELARFTQQRAARLHQVVHAHAGLRLKQNQEEMLLWAAVREEEGEDNDRLPPPPAPVGATRLSFSSSKDEELQIELQ